MTDRRPGPRRVLAALGAGILVIAASACGSDDPEAVGPADETVATLPMTDEEPTDPAITLPATDDESLDPAAGACLEGDPDCFETGAEGTPPLEEPVDGAVDEAAVLAEARALLGTPEEELPGDVRIGRRGDEQMMLTMDYVIGRFTAELDPVDGAMVVTSVTVELTDGSVVVDGTGD